MTAQLPPPALRPPGTEWAGSYPLPNSSRSPALARMLVRQAMSGCPSVVIEEAQLLVSELVTNAVRHAETDLILRIVLEPKIRISVEDTSSDTVGAPFDSTDDEGGRGLAIVEALAGAWGSVPTAAGKQIWFEI